MQTVSTDTDMLREHAHTLRKIGDRIEDSSRELAEPIEREVWPWRLMLVWPQFGDKLQEFVDEYEHAHARARARIAELADIYREAAAGLRIVADQYDLADQ